MLQTNARFWKLVSVLDKLSQMLGEKRRHWTAYSEKQSKRTWMIKQLRTKCVKILFKKVNFTSHSRAIIRMRAVYDIYVSKLLTYDFPV